MNLKYCNGCGKKLKKKNIKDTEIGIGECKKCGLIYPDNNDMCDTADKDMIYSHTNLRKLVKKRFRRTFIESAKMFLGKFSIFVSVLLFIGLLTFVIVTLIENPVSLAISAATIILIFMWRFKK